jgi:hypothetical protein
VRALPVAVFAAALLLAACSSAAHGTATAPAAAPATGAAAPAAPITSPAATATTVRPTTTTEALIPQESPDLAAQALFSAWGRGDRAAALHVATPAAVAALFDRPVAAFSDRGCQQPISERALCAFAVGSGLAQVGTVNLAGGWVVEAVTLE